MVGNNQLKILKKNCFINAPWNELKNTYLDLFLRHGIQPEIGLEGTCLYEESLDDFRKVASLFKKHNLACTLHAPFFDLAPGSFDPYILKKSRDKLQMAFSLLKTFQPRSIVCHLMYEENKHGYVFEEWFDVTLATWSEILQLAQKQNIPVMFENTYEKSPDVHHTFLKKLNSPYARFCLDVGHLMAFSKSHFKNWLPLLSPWLGQVHLHDNKGEKDDHLAPGRGDFDFIGFFQFLKKHNLSPILTFEPHTEDDLWATFEYCLSSGMLDGFVYAK